MYVYGSFSFVPLLKCFENKSPLWLKYPANRTLTPRGVDCRGLFGVGGYPPPSGDHFWSYLLAKTGLRSGRGRTPS